MKDVSKKQKERLEDLVKGGWPYRERKDILTENIRPRKSTSYLFEPTDHWRNAQLNVNDYFTNKVRNIESLH